MEKKKWIAVAVIIAIIVAALAFVEFSGIREDVENRIEEKQMWKAASEELVEKINKDNFFTNKYGEINSWRIIERKIDTDDGGVETWTLTLSCETKGFVIQIYASRRGEENWRYREESVFIK